MMPSANAPRKPYPDSMTRAAAETQLWVLLCSCTDTALAAFSPEYLHRTHKLPLAECERMLRMARQDRIHD